MNKKKNYIWAGSIALAFLSAFAVFLVLLRIEKNEMSEFECETVYIAKSVISKGQEVNGQNFGIFMEPAEINVRYVPEHAIRKETDIKEMTSCFDIEKGVILTEGMFRTVDQITEGMKDPVIAGLKADDIYQLSGGVLRGGDRINILGVNEDGSVTLKWSDIYIQQAFDGAGNSIDPSDSVTAAQRINIFLDKNDVERLYQDLSSVNLRVVKICE